MKKKHLGLIPILTLSMLSCTVVFAENTAETAAKLSAKEASETVTEDNTEDEDPLDHIYTFTLNGTTYTLPCPVTDFTDNDWNLGSGTLDANSYANTLGFYKDNSQNIVFQVANLTEEDKVDLNELTVVGITITQTAITEGGYEFETADGIVPGMTVDEIKALYGEPAHEHETYMSYRFFEYYETEGLRSLGTVYAGEDCFTLYLDENIVSRVQLEYFGIEETTE